MDDEEENYEKRLSLGQLSESNKEKRWRLSHLKSQFECLQLHPLFDRYLQRISHGYFSQFLALQIILIATHFIILSIAVDPKEVAPDLILYGTVWLLSFITLIIADTYVKTHPSLLKYLAGFAFIITFFMNAFIPFYNKFGDKREGYENLRPAYTTYLIISNYIFLNIHNDIVALVIGLFISIFHLVMLILVTYENTDRLYERIGSDSIFLISFNCLGMYFRYMNEIVIRRSFLDRRSCIESTHQLKYEEEQAHHLLASIIPQHIIQKVMEGIQELEKNPTSDHKLFQDLYVEEYPNVTILFADIVNYTSMTTKLKVDDLLDILNELFGRFDDASEELNVLRIKFLGDCYYCVAGLPPNPAPNPAEACVDLGLKMIAIISYIQQRRDYDPPLNINMRIGVHSGTVSCGIIGNIKWQYDIWSKDVDIANKMETEGTPGMVHITEETKNQLNKNYNIYPTSKEINGKPTYLIRSNDTFNPVLNTPKRPEKTLSESETLEEEKRRPSLYMKRVSTTPNDLKNYRQHMQTVGNNLAKLQEGSVSIENERKKDFTLSKRHTFPSEQKVNGLGVFRKSSSGKARLVTDRRLTDTKRRTAFMNNNIKRYKETLEKTNRELEETIEKMLLSKFEQWFKVNDMYRILLVFKDLKSELDFFKMPDPLFKYYLVSELLLLILVFIIENLTLSKWEMPPWPFFVTIGLILFVFLPLSWTHYFWTKYVAKNESDIPTNKLIYFFYKSSKIVTDNIYVRLVIYVILYGFFCACVLAEWVECYEYGLHLQKSLNDTIITTKQNFLLLVTNYYQKTSSQYCIIPWHMTETFALAIIMSFLFLRMYMWLKFFFAIFISIAYAFCITEFSGQFFGDSQTFNYLLTPKTAHIMSVFFLTLTLHLVHRQTEYMNRIDHLWYKNLTNKESQAFKLRKVNKTLLKNILPLHVAELYLNVNRNTSEEVYNESYDDVAVMFATITNFSVEDMGSKFLETMDLVIREFDMLSIETIWGRPIEKIKIAKWTYMAACGLVPGLGDEDNKRKDPHIHVVISLLKFATKLMQTLNEINKRHTKQEMKLRIGISNGPVAAGVVGSKKPLYDIWGDPVNMASRMDTTGLPDTIQVLKSTAEIIESFGYVCNYRGTIRVKGREDLQPTYFVALDENFELIKREKVENTEQQK